MPRLSAPPGAEERKPPPRKANGNGHAPRRRFVNLHVPGKPKLDASALFKLPEFPKGIAPPDKGMAMDEAFFEGDPFAFMRQAQFTSAFVEGQTFMGYPALSILAQRAEYRNIVETIATECTRKWIKIEAAADAEEKHDKIEELNEEFERLELRDVFRKVTELDGFFGRAHLYIDTGDGENREELKIPIGNGRSKLSQIKFKKKQIIGLRAIEPVWTYPTRYNSNDPLTPDWYKPEFWFVMGKEMHRSRLLTFVGREVPDLLKPAYAFGGLSLTQMALPYVDNWLRTRQSVSDLLHSFTIFALGTDLQTMLQEDGNQPLERADFFNAMRDNRSLFMFNKDTEQFENISAPLGSLDQLQAQSQEQMAAVSRIPLVKLLGITPHGLNASSEGEIRVFYDTINAYQERFMRPNLETVFWFIQLAKWGAVDKDLSLSFEPLWSLDEKGEAEVHKIQAETGQVLVDIGAVSREEERKRIAEDPGTPYQGLDVDDMPDLLEEEQEGLAIKGAGGAEKAILGGGEEEGGAQPPDNDGGGADDGVVPFGDEETVVPAGGANAATHGARRDTARGQRAARKGITGGGPTTIGKGPLRHSGARGGFDALPYDAAFDAEWSEADHPRREDGKFGSGGGGGGSSAGTRQTLKMPQYGLTPTPRSPHQQPATPTGGEYFEKNWHKAGSVGGHSQPTEKQIKQYTEAYENQGKEPPGGGAPLKATELKKVGKQLGSNPGGQFEDTAGNRYYVKQARSRRHASNELLAGALYGLAGAPTLKYRPVEGGKHVATEWEKASKTNARQFSPAELKEAQKDFAVHAWLANWDAAGLDYDNQSVINGKPTTNDLGGTLEFRAQGGEKGAAFGNSAGEWDTLRDPKMNPQNAKLFGGMTTAQLKQSAQKVAAIPDADIRETAAAYGLPDLGDKLVARKRDIAKRAGIQAADAAMDETDAHGHEHAPAGSPEGGQFVSKGGAGAGGGGETEGKPKSKMQAVKDLLKQGASAAQMLAAAGWAPSMSKFTTIMGKEGYKIVKNKGPSGITTYKAEPMSEAEKKAFAEKPPEPKEPKQSPYEKAVEKILGPAKNEPPSPTEALEASKQAAAAAAFPPPTPAEIEKAKKSLPLQAQYLGVGSATTPQGQNSLNALVQGFNDKYAGKTLTDPKELAHKVNTFKATQAAAKAVIDVEQKHAANYQKEQAAQQAAKQKAEKEKLKAQHAEVTKELGITDPQDLEAFDSFVEHFGGTQNALSKFKTWQHQAETAAKNNPGHGFEKLSGFEMGCIKAYTGPQSGWINQAVINDTMTPAQYMFEKVLNSALDKLPKISGKTVRRGLSLTQDVKAKLQPGKIWTHRNFASSSSEGWSGNTKLHIETTGKGGAYVAPISSHQGEGETLFKSNLRLHVKKTEDKNGVLHVYCTEM